MSQAPVLIIGSDSPCELLVQSLRHQGVQPLWLRPETEALQLPRHALAGGRLTGSFAHGGRSQALEAVQGIYLRPFGRPGSGSQASALQQQLWCQAWAELGELFPGTVVNRVSAMGSNASKPYQLRLLAGLGFAVPPSLVSNDPAEVLAFEAEQGPLIYKSASGVRSIVRELDDEARSRLDRLRHCPALFQKRLRGSNVRVHVVGQEVHATEIDADVVDYRYASRQGGDAHLRPTTLEPRTRERCLRASQVLGLPFVGLDLMLADDGLTYCFEANPSPGYSFFEDATGQDISGSLARLLRGAEPLH
ncbi:ATP-grasp domain-containing protein [Roseateles flavus]|uniref:ATP-grasp domain-containing protein n=1 Tax=Roseateles flavus TaxID=3149041 RepID=A0ABV0GEU6_9BURK